MILICAEMDSGLPMKPDDKWINTVETEHQVRQYEAFFEAKVAVHLLKITVMVLWDSEAWLANYASPDRSSAAAWTLAK